MNTCTPYGGGHSTCTVPTQPVPTTSVTVTPATANELPFTGGDITGLVLAGTLAVAAGLACLRRGRRRAA